RRLKAADERALAELYDRLAPWVLGLAFRILQDEAESEEVVGDVFVRVWRRVHQHDAQRGPLVPWILSIARNRALDALRRRRRWWRKAERWQQARVTDMDAGSEPASHEASWRPRGRGGCGWAAAAAGAGPPVRSARWALSGTRSQPTWRRSRTP